VRAVTDADVRAVQDAARELVRTQALQRARGTAIQARSLADFIRVNRVEGLALGAGVTQRLGGGWRVGAQGRISTADGDVRGGGVLAWERRQVVLRADLPPLLERRWRVALEAAVERHTTATINASPSRGRYEPVPAISAGDFVRGSLLLRRATALGPLGTEVALASSAELISARTASTTIGRGTIDLDVQRPFGKERLVLRTIAAGVTGRAVPVQYETWLGGPVSMPGYGFHALRGRAGVSQRLEWQHPVPGPTIPLGRYGNVPGEVLLAPFAMVAWTDGRSATAGALPRGTRTAIGMGAIGLFNLLRLDVARGLSDGRWLFSVDVTRDFWRIL
jgi:hypothetical protein